MLLACASIKEPERQRVKDQKTASIPEDNAITGRREGQLNNGNFATYKGRTTKIISPSFAWYVPATLS